MFQEVQIYCLFNFEPCRPSFIPLFSASFPIQMASLSLSHSLLPFFLPFPTKCDFFGGEETNHQATTVAADGTCTTRKDCLSLSLLFAPPMRKRKRDSAPITSEKTMGGKKSTQTTATTMTLTLFEVNKATRAKQVEEKKEPTVILNYHQCGNSLGGARLLFLLSFFSPPSNLPPPPPLFPNFFSPPPLPLAML